jgi:hypothetical protein
MGPVHRTAARLGMVPQLRGVGVEHAPGAGLGPIALTGHLAQRDRGAAVGDGDRTLRQNVCSQNRECGRPSAGQPLRTLRRSQAWKRNGTMERLAWHKRWTVLSFKNTRQHNGKYYSN